jgi:hypothetical protein
MFPEQGKLLGGLSVDGSFFCTFGLENSVQILDIIFLKRGD